MQARRVCNIHVVHKQTQDSTSICGDFKTDGVENIAPESAEQLQASGSDEAWDHKEPDRTPRIFVAGIKNDY